MQHWGNSGSDCGGVVVMVIVVVHHVGGSRAHVCSLAACSTGALQGLNAKVLCQWGASMAARLLNMLRPFLACLCAGDFSGALVVTKVA